jgi:lysophospholipase
VAVALLSPRTSKEFRLSLIATAADPVPKGAAVDWLAASDGTRFRVARWCPPAATRGTVVVLPGRTEFIEKYFEVIDALLERGFCAAALDWRGQGLSDRPLPNPHKGHVEDFDLYVSDLGNFLRSFVEPECPRPYHLLSHSMGGNIALRYLAGQQQSFSSAIFSAPMWGIGRAARPHPVVRGLAALTNAWGLGSLYVPGAGGDFGEGSRRFEGNPLTRDRQRFERAIAQIDAEPRLALGGPTLGWLKQAIASIDTIQAPGFAESVRTRIWVCSAGDDALVSLDAQAEIVERLQNAQQIWIDGAQHELLMEKDSIRDRVFAVFEEL